MKKALLFSTIMILFIFIKIFFFSPFSEEYIKKTEWRFESGDKVGEGDFMEFTTSKNIFYLKNDTIYYKNKPKAIIESSNRIFYTLTVENINSGEKGYYIDMEGHFRGFW